MHSNLGVTARSPDYWNVTEDHAGVEPAASAWKAEVLATTPMIRESDWRESNPRHHHGKVKCSLYTTVASAHLASGPEREDDPIQGPDAFRQGKFHVIPRQRV